MAFWALEALEAPAVAEGIAELALTVDAAADADPDAAAPELAAGLAEVTFAGTLDAPSDEAAGAGVAATDVQGPTSVQSPLVAILNG